MKRVLVIMSLWFSIALPAQERKVTTLYPLWLAYQSQFKFSDRWGAWADIQSRTNDDIVRGNAQQIYRAAITYSPIKNWQFAVGYAYAVAHRGNKLQLSQPEHRPWAQMQVLQKGKKLNVAHRFRIEERFFHQLSGDSLLVSGYTHFTRWRYQLLMQYPIAKEKNWKVPLHIVVNDEIMLNSGSAIDRHVFDQNRVYLGCSARFSKNTELQVGYLYIWQHLAKPAHYRETHAIRVTLQQYWDFRK